jgi:tape measure domain-containing protein
MATSNAARDVRLTLGVDVTGEEGIQRLAADVRTLAKEGGDAAPELRRIADDIDRLGQQAAAVTTLKTLAAEVRALGESQAAATGRADELRAALLTQRDAAQGAAAQQTALQRALDGARVQALEASGALKTYNEANKGAARSTDEYKKTVLGLGDARTKANVAVELAAQALREGTKSANEAAAAERKLSAEYASADTAARAATNALRQRGQAQEQAVASALALGVATEDLAAADARLLTESQRLASTAAQTVDAQRAQVAATEQLTAAKREQAAVDAALADLDEQNNRALLERQALLVKAAQAYEKDTQETLRAADAAEKLGAAQRLAADHAEALTIEADRQAAVLREGADAMRKLEEASNRADAQQRELVASLRAAEAAAAEYAAATERAAAAGADDVRASQERQRAATALLDAERALSAEQRELAAQRNANRAGLVAEAQAYATASIKAREYAAASQQAVASATRAGAEIEKSFGVLGIRSLDAIKAEIQAVKRSFESLQRQASSGRFDNGMKELERAAGAAQVRLAQLRTELAQVQATPGQFEALGASINSLINRFAGLGAAVATVGVAVRPVLDATMALEAMRRTLTTVTGSAEAAAEQIEFVRTVASRSGQAFEAVGQSYSKFAASALQTGLSLKDTQDVFESVALAAGNLGLSTDQSGRALEALSQIASKGVAGMEELRQQLGDALPGVLPLLATELGLTTGELNRLVESGQLLASEAIPAIGRSLRKLGPEQGAQVEGLRAEWNRFISVIKEAGVAIVEGPLGQAAGVVLKGVAVAVGALATTAVAASEGFKVLGVSVLATLDALRGNQSWEQAGKVISDFARESGERVAALTSRIDRMVGASEAGAEASVALADGLAQTAAAAVRASGGTDQQAKSMSKLVLELGEAVTAAERQTQVTEKLAQAAEQEAKAQKTLIDLLDDEGVARRLTADAAEKVAVARERVAESATAEVQALVAGKTAVLARVGADEKLLAANKLLIEQFDQKIAKADADREKSQALADTTRNQADAARVAAKAYGDQSAEAENLRKRVDEAGRTLEAVTKLQREGWLVTKDVVKAERDLLEAKQLLTDALKDQDAATKRTIDSLKAAASVTKAEIALEITKLEIKKQNLIADGRAAEAARLDLEIKRLQLSATKAGTEAKLAEARATQELIIQQYNDAEARGVLTPAMRQELNTRFEQQRAIILETEASKLNEEQQRKNIDAAVAGTGARRESRAAVEGHTGAVGTNTGAVGTNTGALRENERAKRDNAVATGALAAEQEKYATALERARREEGITGRVDGSTVGQGPAGIGGGNRNDPFSNAGRQARNDSFSNTPFQSGSTGGTVAGQFQPPDNSGDWVFDAAGYSRATANNTSRLSAPNPRDFWRRGPTSSGVAGNFNAPTLGAGGAFDIANPFGNRTPTAPATVTDTGRVLVSTDTDTPGTVGTVSNVPVLGKYEFVFRNDVTGVSTSGFQDTAEQAQAFIDNLQAAFRSANGG